jgi:hypothetical protein
VTPDPGTRLARIVDALAGNDRPVEAAEPSAAERRRRRAARVQSAWLRSLHAGQRPLGKDGGAAANRPS